MELRLRKKSRISMMVIGMLLMSTVFASAAEMQATVIASQGIVRKTGSFNGEVVKTLPIGTKVSVLEIQDSWYRIQEEDFDGWMYQDILTLEDSPKKLEKGTTIVSILNVRNEPSTNGRIITKLSQGTEVIIIARQQDWYQIKSEQAENAWIHRDFVRLIPNYPPGVVLNNDVALRVDPSITAESILILKKDEIVYIKDYQDGWYRIVTDQFVEGWTSLTDLELQINVVKPVSRSGERSSILHNISENAKKYLGKKYSYGQTGPNTFDCSGFTFYILNTYYNEYLDAKEITLPRTSRDQATVGSNIDRGDLQQGDLVFFNTDSKMGKTITHVGIYIGNGEFIHASSARAVVMISSLEEGYYDTRYIKAIRL